MGARGPKPKPAEVRKREGTYRQSEHGPVVVLGGKPSAFDAPAHMSDRARAAWDELVPLLVPVGLLDRADAPALEAMCCAVAQWREANDVLQAEGLFVASPNGYRVAHPAIAVANKAAAEYRSWCARFGLTPSDRIGLGIAAVRSRSLSEDLADRIGPSPRVKVHKA
jgi:P27 family predicted phage terminase small subunit